MGYTNSGLVDVTMRSPNHSGLRTHKIDYITPHCVVGQLTASGIGSCFPAGRDASCNYGIGRDGRVVLVVDEKNRSWCTSSGFNDQRAVTIECASDAYHPYAMNTAVYNKLVALITDICRRNGIRKLLWKGSAQATWNYTPKAGEACLTAHRWYDNKSCPGEWLYSRYGQLAADVNKKLGGGSVTPAAPEKIDEDGLWGIDTTYRAQAVFRTPEDGEVSDQNVDCRQYLPACIDDSWEWVTYPDEGSLLIKAIQRKCGLRGDDVDGIAGKKTVMAMQRWLNKELGIHLDVDGYLGEKTCKAFQIWLNKQK